jgi:hypothetical protein
VGDLAIFRSVADKYAAVFKEDKTSNLIVRLRQNVIRTGLRRINLAYSRISLKVISSSQRMSCHDGRSSQSKSSNDQIHIVCIFSALLHGAPLSVSLIMAKPESSFVCLVAKPDSHLVRQ